EPRSQRGGARLARSRLSLRARDRRLPALTGDGHRRGCAASPRHHPAEARTLTGGLSQRVHPSEDRAGRSPVEPGLSATVTPWRPRSGKRKSPHPSRTAILTDQLPAVGNRPSAEPAPPPLRQPSCLAHRERPRRAIQKRLDLLLQRAPIEPGTLS